MLINSYKVRTIASICLAVFMLLGVALPVLAQELDFAIPDIGTGKQDLQTTVGSIIKVALSFLGVIAIVIVLIGGFKYMTAGGSDEKTGDAKKYIISGIIGIAIILSAYAITQFVLSSLLTATTEE